MFGTERRPGEGGFNVGAVKLPQLVGGWAVGLALQCSSATSFSPLGAARAGQLISMCRRAVRGSPRAMDYLALVLRVAAWPGRLVPWPRVPAPRG